jgi:uncharacterized protein
MKITGLFLIGFFTGIIFSNAQSVHNAAGTWGGVLVASNPLKIIFHVKQDTSGNLSATADSPDQHAFGMSVQKVILDTDSITFIMGDIHAAYTAKVDWNTMQMDGNWMQGNYTFPLVLKKLPTDTSQPVLYRPQEPHPPYPYISKDVVFSTPDSSMTYSGTLTYPSGEGKFPTVILISGSGQQNRNETIMGHKPFLVLADYLTRRGIAVLRVDDRGIGQTTDPNATFTDNTTADFSQDVINEIRYLKTIPQVDSKEIGLIGHSEGGMIATMVDSKENKEIAFIVLLASPGERIIDLMTTQMTSPLLRLHYSEPVITAYRNLMYHTMEIVNNTPLNDSANFAIADYFDQWQKEQPDSILEKLHADGATGMDFAKEEQPLLSPWFRYFLKFDPAEFLQKVTCPVLALNGGKDVQVDASENLPAIKDALEKGGNKNFKIIEMPGMNHLFQTAKTGEVNEYGTITETMSPKVLQIIGDWILQQVKK